MSLPSLRLLEKMRGDRIEGRARGRARLEVIVVVAVVAVVVAVVAVVVAVVVVFFFFCHPACLPNRSPLTAHRSPLTLCLLLSASLFTIKRARIRLGNASAAKGRRSRGKRSSCEAAGTRTHGAAALSGRMFTDDAPGIKFGPTMVLVMCVSFIAFVVVLHIWGRFTS